MSYATTIDLKQSDFDRVRHLLHEYSGIHMHEGKKALVRARLMKRIRKLGMGSFEEYLDYVERENGGREFLEFVDVLTTNKTSFFRESQHFDFIRDEVIPAMGGRSAKWWSAGCSSGEEPVTCAITLLEARKAMPGAPVKILATDLSRQVLQKAKAGLYPIDRVREMPGIRIENYFDKVDDTLCRVNPGVQKMITYGRLNLKASWPLNGPFHLIMCRNVMIYFNRQTQQRLVDRFRELLEPGGYLFLGHSESISGGNRGFRNIRPAVYQKV